MSAFATDTYTDNDLFVSTLEELRGMHHNKFEHLCGKVLQTKFGGVVKVSKIGPDDGLDVVLENNGEIYLGQATAILLQTEGNSDVSRRSAACELVELAADRNARLPWTLHLQNFCKSKGDDDDDRMQRLREFVADTMERTLEMVQPKSRADQLPLLPYQR